MLVGDPGRRYNISWRLPFLPDMELLDPELSDTGVDGCGRSWRFVEAGDVVEYAAYGGVRAGSTLERTFVSRHSRVEIQAVEGVTPSEGGLEGVTSEDCRLPLQILHYQGTRG